MGCGADPADCLPEGFLTCPPPRLGTGGGDGGGGGGQSRRRRASTSCIADEGSMGLAAAAAAAAERRRALMACMADGEARNGCGGWREKAGEEGGLGGRVEREG